MRPAHDHVAHPKSPGTIAMKAAAAQSDIFRNCQELRAARAPALVSAQRANRYLARLNLTSPRPSPPDVTGTVYVNSSPVIANGRLCSVPVQFGYELKSMFKMRILSASLTVYLPSVAMLPATAAPYAIRSAAGV